MGRGGGMGNDVDPGLRDPLLLGLYIRIPTNPEPIKGRGLLILNPINPKPYYNPYKGEGVC